MQPTNQNEKSGAAQSGPLKIASSAEIPRSPALNGAAHLARDEAQKQAVKVLASKLPFSLQPSTQIPFGSHEHTAKNPQSASIITVANSNSPESNKFKSNALSNIIHSGDSRRIDFSYEGLSLHASRTPLGEELAANLLLANLEGFCTPIAAISLAKTDSHTPGFELKNPIKRTYLIVQNKKGYAPLGDNEFEYMRQNKVRSIVMIGRVLSTLAIHYHSKGLRVVDSSPACNMVFSKEKGLLFRSPSHMEAIANAGEGTLDVVRIINEFRMHGVLEKAQSLLLIQHYLASSKSCYSDCQQFISSQEGAAKSSDPLDVQIFSLCEKYYSKFHSKDFSQAA